MKSSDVIRGFAAVLFAANLLFVLLISAVEIVCYHIPGLYEKEFRKYDVLGEMAYWRGETMQMEDLSEVMKETMLYLRGRRSDLIVETKIDGKDTEFYNETEKSHMADVRDVFLAGIRLRRIAAVICLVCLLFISFRDKRSARMRTCAVRKVPCGTPHTARKTRKRVLNWQADKTTLFAGGRTESVPFLLARGYRRMCRILLILGGGIGILAAIDFNQVFVWFHQIFFSQGNWQFDPRESRMIDVMPEGFFADMALFIVLAWAVCVLVLWILSLILTRKGRTKGE